MALRVMLVLLISITINTVCINSKIIHEKKTHYVEKVGVDSNFNNKDTKDSVVQDDAIDIEYTNETVFTKITHLNNSYNELTIHWVGNGSNHIYCLAKDSNKTFSNVYISYDYGNNYIDKTHLFQLEDGSLSTINQFYFHPIHTSAIVFTDTNNKVIFVTKGEDINRINLHFTPHEVSFHSLLSDFFLVLDKSDLKGQALWLTEDFGVQWFLLEEYVKLFYWVQDSETKNPTLVLHRDVNGSSEVGYYKNFQSKKLYVLATHVKEIIYAKGDYIFFTKYSSEDNVALFVVHKLGVPSKCIFDTKLSVQHHFIVDVTENKALIAVTHTETLCNLYVSEYLNINNEEAHHFILSLERIFCYLPNKTWQSTWLEISSKDAFADIYKVKGVTNVYIASQISTKQDHDVDFISLITFDHGKSWRSLTPPVYDSEGFNITCFLSDNCSLHLNQRYSHLQPNKKLQSILSSVSAPGIIIATGVVGKSLKGNSNVYISTDAGLTWNQILKNSHLFQIGNDGGVIAAVKYTKNEQTQYVLYSTDFGKTWTQVVIHEQNIYAYGLLTEGNERTAVITMLASKTDPHKLLILKLDLKKVFDDKCTQNDYEEWYPKHISCVFGTQIAYSRKIPTTNCYVDPYFVKQIQSKPCACTITDFECDSGFFHPARQLTCIRNKNITKNPYEIPSTCQPGQSYNRTKGYNKIQGNQCVAGFEHLYLPDVVACPEHRVNEFLLVALRDRIGRYDLINRVWDYAPIKNLTNVIAVDFDVKKNCIYWSDINTHIIGRQCLTDNVTQALVINNISSVEGIAFDWISNNLYFLDAVRAKIEMIRTNTNNLYRMRTTIVESPNLTKPRGIAVHPVAGYLFWTDWSIYRPSVSRSNLDGSDVKVLFNETNVKWPNGITIDYTTERIYWVDARLDYIGSSDLNGNFFKKIIHNNGSVVSHPFGIAVLNNNIYWSDWILHAIFKANKNDGGEVESVAKMRYMFNLKVFGNSTQKGINGCDNSSCSHICVGAPKQSYVCLCPDGMHLIKETCVCNNNQTCPETIDVCDVDHFRCNNDICVLKELQCNGKDDCGDGSDEAQCDSFDVAHKNKSTLLNNNHCKTDEFHCVENNMCIPSQWRCDGKADCKNGSDEFNCSKRICPESQFMCITSKVCIPNIWRCDGDADCPDQSDEEGCQGHHYQIN